MGKFDFDDSVKYGLECFFAKRKSVAFADQFMPIAFGVFVECVDRAGAVKAGTEDVQEDNSRNEPRQIHSHMEPWDRVHTVIIPSGPAAEEFFP